MRCPYYPGAEYQLQLWPRDQHSTIPIQVTVKVLEVFQPITVSPVLKVALRTASPATPTTLPSIMVLKVYDRRYSVEAREYYRAPDPTPESEREFRAFISADSAAARRTPQEWKVKHYKGTEMFRPEETEAFLDALFSSYHKNEVSVYERMASMQGKDIPVFLGEARFLGCNTHPDVADTTDVPVILLEYVPGLPLKQLPANAISPEICQKCLDIVQAFGDNGVLNEDVRLQNFIVPLTDDRPVVMIDFAQTRMRREDEGDEEWKRAKWSTDEEGAVGCALKRDFGWDYKPTWRYMSEGDDDSD